jgi:polysaccharide chain length determinant protein (PEP-CTERM system associated)
MATTTPSAPPDASGSLGLTYLLTVLRHRRTLAVLPLALVLAAAISLAMFLPNLWSAKAVIRVDRQRIAESLVKSAVAGDLERQLLSLSQEIMSRTRLHQIITDHRLYPNLEHRPNAAVERMRRDITLDVIGGEERSRARDDLRLVAFSIAYRALDPAVAVTVANRLAELYVEENMHAREAQAARSSEFLDMQMAEVRQQLQEQERRVAEYKERHLGELPEQRDTNLRTLERLQQQLQFAQENQRRANERRQLLARTLSEIDQTSSRPPPAPAEPDISLDRAGAGRLILLRRELEDTLRTRGEQHPQVASLQAQIAALETRKAPEAPAALPRQQPTTSEGNPRRPAPDNPYVVSLMQQLSQANVETKALGEDIAALHGQIATVQRRLENTPRRERELAQLTQDHDALRELFRSLATKRSEAGMTADLEQRQKGETFRIIETAAPPEAPIGPNRLRLILFGLAVGLALSAVAVIAAEQLDSSYRSADEVRSTLAVPVLSSIPRIVTDADRNRQAWRRLYATAAVAGSLALVVATAFVMARDNEGLATMLSPKTPLAAKR